jgi:hypothetical protein
VLCVKPGGHLGPKYIGSLKENICYNKMYLFFDVILVYFEDIFIADRSYRLV